MPGPAHEEKMGLIHLTGLGSSEYDDRTLRLIREAYRHGWEAAQRSHDEWMERRGD